MSDGPLCRVADSIGVVELTPRAFLILSPRDQKPVVLLLRLN